MKHLNLELEKLEQRIAPGIFLGGSLGLGVGVSVGGGYCCPETCGTHCEEDYCCE